MPGYLYYSTSCTYCRDLITLMTNNGIAELFRFESIDKLSVDDIARLQLQQVPALIIVSQHNPQIYEGTGAFEWVKKYIINRRKNAEHDAENGRKMIQSDNMRAALQENLFGFNLEEKIGISNTYAIWHDNLADDKNIPLPQSFASYDPNDKTDAKIITIPVGKPAEYRAKEGLNAVYGPNGTKKIISSVENIRKKQNEEISSVMERNRLQCVMNTSI